MAMIAPKNGEDLPRRQLMMGEAEEESAVSMGASRPKTKICSRPMTSALIERPHGYLLENGC